MLEIKIPVLMDRIQIASKLVKPQEGCKDSLVYNLGSCYSEVSVE